MPLATNNPATLIPQNQQMTIGLKDIATRLVNYAARQPNPDDPIGMVGKAIASTDSWLNTIHQILRQQLPLPADFYLTDPAGRQVVQFGFQAQNATQIYGLSVFDLGGNLAGFVGVQTELPQAITATSNGSPDVITITAHGYVNGDTVLIQGSNGDTAINIVGIVEQKTANTFQLTDLLGNPINGNGTYTGGGTATRYFGGGYFQTLAIGGKSVPTAKIRAFADGNVSINGARIELDGSQATIILDPTVGQITVTGVVTGVVTKIQSSGTVIGDLTDGSAVFLTPGEIQVTNNLGAFRITISGSGVDSIPGYLVNGVAIVDSLRNASFVNTTVNQLTVGTFGLVIASTGDINIQSLTLHSSSYLIASSGDANLNSLSINGTPRINSTGNATLNSVSVNGGGINSVGVVSSTNGAAGTVTLANLTPTGSTGSISFTNGIVTGFINPT